MRFWEEAFAWRERVEIGVGPSGRGSVDLWTERLVGPW
jgi:hypothetical protein